MTTEPLRPLTEDEMARLEGMPDTQLDAHTGSKYIRRIKPRHPGEPTTLIDVYNVIDCFDVKCPAVAHAVKKMLCAGLREKNDRLQDLIEAKDALLRAIELERQRTNV